MDRHNFMDIYENLKDDLSLPVQIDPIKHNQQEQKTRFPWLYKVRSSVLFTEEFDPERRIKDAYSRSVKQETGTLLFHPYKKLYSSRVFSRFILQDPYDPQYAIIKYCREKPLKFIIFGKPGVNIVYLGEEIAKYWKSIHINPDIVAKTDSFRLDSKIQNKLRKGYYVGISETWKFIKDMMKSPESKRQGYVLSGVPLRDLKNSEYDIIDQMEFIFQNDIRPDIVIYVTCPTTEIMRMNEQGYIEDLNTSYHYNISHVKDGEKLSNRRDQIKENDDYNSYLMTEYNNFFEKETNGLIIRKEKLPYYSKNILHKYTKNILPLIDSYVLEYDSQCLIKVDGRVPVMKMLNIVQEKLNVLPFFPVCEAKPLFELSETKVEIDTEFLDDRSEDSIEESKIETYEEETDEDEPKVEGEEEEGENEETAERGDEEEEEQKNKDDSADYLNKMETRAALKRLKTKNPIHPNFKWCESDFGVLCPVEFERGNICMGIPEYTCSYLGNLYMTSNSQAMKQFLYDPNRYIIPPKPFPTLKIFVIGPPCSGKTTTVRLLSEFFQLKIVSIKELIEQITLKKFYELEMAEYMKKMIKVKKLDEIEEGTFYDDEERRAEDIVNWVKDQLQIIYKRAKYTSLVQLPLSDLELPSDETKPGEESRVEAIPDDVEEPQVPLHKKKLILPKIPGLTDSIKKLSKTNELRQIIRPDKYEVDFPPTSGMKIIYKNPYTDLGSALIRKVSLETADLEIQMLQTEFENKQLDFFSDTEKCQSVLHDPLKLLPYLPEEMRTPYYQIPIIDFNDQRIRKKHIEDVGIRTSFGYVPFRMEELADAFEKKILTIEAEMNLKRKGNDLRLGGWVVDDIPLHKIFWNILTERFLLPDDIIVQKVTNETYTGIVDNFCNIVNFKNENSGDKDLTEENKLTTNSTSDDSLNDPHINRFLEVKNSFLKINDHYENMLNEKPKNLKKVCDESSEATNTNETETMKGNTENIDIYKWPERSDSMEDTRFINNPFDLKEHYIKPICYSFWSDDEFLSITFEEITNRRIIPVVAKNSQIIQTEPESNEIDNQETASPKEIDSGQKFTNCLIKKKKKTKDDEESISSSSQSSEENKDVKKQKSSKSSQFQDKIKQSSSRKKERSKTGRASAMKSRKESLFELRDTMITDNYYTNKVHKLHEIFHPEINSFIEGVTHTGELKYLNEIKILLQENASMKTIGKAMQKYVTKFVKSLDYQSEENIKLETASADIVSMSKTLKPVRNKELLNILSNSELRLPLGRVSSKIRLDHIMKESTESLHLQRNPEETKVSTVSLPVIKDRKISSYDKKNLENLFYPMRKGSQEKKNEKLSQEMVVKTLSQEMEVKTLSQEMEVKTLSQEMEVKTLSQEMVVKTSSQEMAVKTSSKDIRRGSGREEEEIHEEGSIYYDSSDIICHRSSDKDFQTSSSVALNLDVEPKPTKIQLPTCRHSRKFHLPLITQPSSKIDQTHSCYCADENRQEYCTCCSSTESLIMIGRQKKRLCVWHESSSTIFPWVPERGRKLKLEESSNIKVETIILKKLHKKLALPTISTSETENLEGSEMEMKDNQIDKDILEHEFNVESELSLIYPTSSDDIIKWRKRPDWDNSPPDKSTEEFKINVASSTSIINKEDYDSEKLLPNINATEWERFINFINSIYLNVSTLHEVGYETVSSIGSFYLECCPSGSDSVLSGYHPKNSSRERERKLSHHSTSTHQTKSESFTADEIKTIAKEFVMKLYGHSDEYEERDYSIEGEDGEHEDLCVLEVNLPLTESRYGTALNTALTCLTHGKTISELFSADKHELGGRKRLSSFQLNIMEQDESVKVIKEESAKPSLDRISSEFFYSDELLNENKKFIELFEGNLIRYRSLDQRHDDQMEEGIIKDYDIKMDDKYLENVKLKLFLKTVPKAILYIPLVMEKKCKIDETTSVTCNHLRRYYLLQSQSYPTYTEKKSRLTLQYMLPESLEKIERNIFYNENHSQSFLIDNDRENETCPSKMQSSTQSNPEILEEFEGVEVHEESEGEEVQEDFEGDKVPEEFEGDDVCKNKECNAKKPSQLFSRSIISLIFEKYQIISLESQDEEDYDEELNAALSDITLPRSFKRFLRALNYNVQAWLNEWDAFQNEILKDIRCNLVNSNFIHFYDNLETHKNTIILDFLHNYEPLAHIIKEELLKTTDLETENLETVSLRVEEEEEESESHKMTLEQDIGDTEVRELFPDGFSDLHPYCPVIFNNRSELVPVNNSLKAEYRDEWYNFSSDEAMKSFIDRPEKFVPLRYAEYTSTPIRICIVAPGDFEGVYLSRSIADFFNIPLMTLSNEIKKVKNPCVDLPVGVLDEDQKNIKLFSLEGENSKQDDPLENERWDHFRNYYNFTSALAAHEIDAIIEPLWKHDIGFTLYSFPYSFNDLEYLCKKDKIPDVIIFVDNEKQRAKEKQTFENRIKARQLLNFGARLKKLLAADHLRFECWKNVYPRLFNIVLRKFLKERRRERNFRERINLIKPTIIESETSITSEPGTDEPEQKEDWDVDWLMYQVSNDAHEKAIGQGLQARRVQKFLNVMDDPSITLEIKQQFLESLQSKSIIPEIKATESELKEELISTSDILNTSRTNISATINSEMQYFPDLNILLDSTINADKEPSKEEIDSKSSGASVEVYELQEYRQRAIIDFFDPTLQKRFLPKTIPEIFQSKRPFDENEYKHNVTQASSSSSLGLNEIDSIKSREITSSLSLIDVDEFNREERLLHLIFGKQPPLKGHLINIVKKYKELYPTPKSNARNLKKVRLQHSRDQLNDYYQKQKDNVKKMKDFCDRRNIANIIYNKKSSFNNLLQNIKNVLRKPNALDKVYIISYELAIELVRKGRYFLSRFGYWCPVQIYEKENPILPHYPNKIKVTKIIPVIHKRYIYFIHGRDSAIKFSETPLKYIKQNTLLTIFPIKVAIIGSHKSKKSSTAMNLAKLHGLELITLEKVLKYVTEKLYWTELSRNIIETLRKGEKIPGSCLIECTEAFINSSSKSLTYGWIMDGFPIDEDYLQQMKESDIIPQVIFSIETDDEYTKNIFEYLTNDRNETQNIIYEKEEYIDMINDELEDNYNRNDQSNGVYYNDFDKNLIEFEIKSLLPPVLIMETRIVNWLFSVKQYDNLLNKIHRKWGIIHKIEWKKTENELLYSVNEVLMIYLWELQEYNSNLIKGLPTSIHLVGITEDEFNLHKSPFKDCCPGCWYYHRIYFRCPTCKFEDMKPGLIQYQNFFYWLCLQHYNAFLLNPLKFLMSYKTVFGKQYPEKANIGEQYIKHNLDIMCNGICITCYYKNLPDLVHNKGFSQYSVIIEQKKIYLFCSEKCVIEMLMNPTRFLNVEIEGRKKDKIPTLPILAKDLPPKGYCEKLVTETIYECIRKFLFLRPKIYNLSHKSSACTYLGLNLKIRAKEITDQERNYYKELLEYLENHCKENEILCKNINQIISFLSPLAMLEYERKKSMPKRVQDLLIENILPVYQEKTNKSKMKDKYK